MKKILLATTAFAAVAASASAVDVEMYGQVNKGVFAIDDGVSTDVSIIDNDFSSTRLGFKGAQALDNGLTASVLFEAEMQSNASDVITQGTVATNSSAPVSTGGTFAERQARVGLGGNWGAVFVGQQSVATDSAAEQDLVGARDVMGSDLEDIGGGYQFRNSAGALTGTTVSDIFDNFDGGRTDAIRYDSPIYNGFQGRASLAQGGDADMAVYYAGEMSGMKVKGALGYMMNNDEATGSTAAEEALIASFTAKHESGLAGTIAYGKAKVENADDPKNLYLKAGYSWDNKEVAVDYGKADASATTEGTTYGVAGQMNLGSGVSVGGLFRQFEADITGTDTDEVKLYGVNMRVKF